MPSVRVPGVEALEDNEDPVEVLGLDTDPVVLHGEPPECPRPFGRDADLGRHVRPAVLQGVADQVREDLRELGRVGHHLGQVADLDRGAGLADRRLHQPERVGHDLRGVCRDERLGLRLDP